MVINNNSLRVRFVAESSSELERGLMHAKPLDDDETALFAFSIPGKYAFWNKNVSFGLTLAFLGGDGRVLDMKDMDARSEAMCSPKSDQVRFVVEAAQGALGRRDVRIGDILHHGTDGLIQIRRVR